MGIGPIKRLGELLVVGLGVPETEKGITEKDKGKEGEAAPISRQVESTICTSMTAQPRPGPNSQTSPPALLPHLESCLALRRRVDSSTCSEETTEP